MPSQELIDAMLANQPPPAPTPPMPSRRLINAMMGDQEIPSSLGDALYQTGRNALLAPFRNPAATAELGLAIAPGSGEAMSARDAWNASGRGGNALLAGDYGQAASEYGNMGAALLGALPGAGIIARGTRRGAAWMDRNLPTGVNRLLDNMMPSDPGNTTNIFAGPTAKTADHAALARAQEMSASGVGRDAIHADTGWFQGVDGKWRFEIDDSGAALKGLEKGKVARFSGIDHPELEDAYGRLAPVHGMVKPGAPEKGAFLPGNPPYVHAQGSNSEAAKSVALHEFQHGAQHVEGFAPGGSPKSFARELSTGGYDNGYETYRRLAGEVEARNVQNRMNMTAAERRAKAPWLTQDVPDEQQIVMNRLLGNGGGLQEMAFPAWHGSPHDFDEFKLDKIGTGEGAQVYGHGLYFAENPAVARQYRDDLSNKGYTVDGDQVFDDITAHWADVKRRGDGDLAAQFARYSDDAEYWRKMVDEKKASGGSAAMALERHMSAQQNADAIGRVMKGDVVSVNPGRLYHTEIDAEPHQLLDWDKPLSEQSQSVRDAMWNAYEKFRSDPNSPLLARKQFEELSAGDAYGAVARTPYADPGKASAALREAGIPGIRYLDQGSRGAGEGSRNFVIFDDQLVKILGKE